MNLLCSTAVLAVVLTAAPAAAPSNASALEAEVRRRTAEIAPKLIAWRHDIHQHPELGDQEHRTARVVEQHLRRLGLEVRTGVARTGVVGILKGGRPGRTVALRADMDALPVKEDTKLPFASKATATLQGQQVPVAHACGHDAHTAMLMAAAEVLAGMRAELPGTVVFLFQPAEEGSSLVSAASGKSWGAKLMLEEGVFKKTRPDAVFALHVMPGPSGEISYRTGPVAASSDTLEITITGKQGHGGMPWNTIDAITTSALAITGLQTVVSRRANLTASPAVVSIGTINGGSRNNIVAEKVVMSGTIRTYDEGVRAQVHRDIHTSVEHIAASAGAKGAVTIIPTYAVTVNDEALTRQMAPVLERAADGQVTTAPLAGASEDFSFFAKAAPGMYVFLGATPAGQDPAKAAPNHSPKFVVDDGALEVGARVLASLAVGFLTAPPPSKEPAPASPFVQEPSTPRP